MGIFDSEILGLLLAAEQKYLAAKWVQSWGHAKQCTDFHSHEELKQLVPKKMIKEELYLSYNFICP